MVSNEWRCAIELLSVLHNQVRIVDCPWEGHIPRICAALEYELPEKSSPDAQRRVRVAFELLHTLWILDQDVWRTVMLECIGDNDLLPNWVIFPWIETAMPLMITIHVNHSIISEPLLRTQWETLLNPTIQLTETEATVRQTLRRVYGRNGQVSISMATPLRLNIAVNNIKAEVFPQYVKMIIDMVEAVQVYVRGPSDTISSHTCAPFKLTSLSLYLSYTITRSIAHEIMRVRALDIPFDQLTISVKSGWLRKNLEEDRTDPSRLLTALLDSSPSIEHSRFAIDSLTVSNADVLQFCNLCTALETTRNVKRVYLSRMITSDSPAERATKWEHLMQALSKTSIQEILLIDEFQHTDVAAVARAFQAIDGRSDGIRAFAQENFCIATQPVDPRSLMAIPLLLAQFGQALTRLTIAAWSSNFSVTSVVGILHACPNLLYFDMTGLELNSMGVFLDLYEHHNSRIRVLRLNNVKVPNEAVTAFAQTLGNPKRKAFRVLRELSFTTVRRLNFENMDAFYTLLNTPESSLEYFQLRVHEPLLSEYQTRFNAYHNTWGTGIAEVVPLRCKIAFLSVCQSCCDHEEGRLPRLMNRLDHGVVSLMFQFAAVRVRKRVCLIKCD